MKILDVLNDVLDVLGKAYGKKRKDVSISLLSRCLRATWFRMQSGQESVTNAVVYGTERHHWMERHFPAELEKYGFRCSHEVRVEYSGIPGYIDLLCEKDGTRYVIELKFTSIPSAWNPFVEWHRRQLKYYIAVADAVGVLILMDFNLEQSYKEVVTLTGYEKEQVLKELKDRYETLKSGSKPPPEKGPWCKSCFFRHQCMTGELV